MATKKTFEVMCDGSAPHVNNIVLTDLAENLTRFGMAGVPTFTSGQLAAPGLPQAAPHEWYPCHEFELTIDPENLIPEEDNEVITVYEPLTMAQLQCLCRNEETWGQMIQWGYLCHHFVELYYYHPNYLGNTEYITDAGGYPYQYFYYSPFGESLVTQKANNMGDYTSPFRFNAKELDEETGNYYYGARYYNPKWSLWLSVDPLARQFPHQSPYAFTDNNPIMLVDPDGRAPVFDPDGNLLGPTADGWGGVAIVMGADNYNESLSDNEALKIGGQRLDKYGEGIRISDDSWNEVVGQGGDRMTPFVVNNSESEIFYKPEGYDDNGVNLNPDKNASSSYRIGAGMDLYAPVDGIKTSKYKNAVFKITDGNKVSVEAGGNVSVSQYDGWKGVLKQTLGGGWNPSVGYRSDWKHLQNRKIGDRSYKSWQYNW